MRGFENLVIKEDNINYFPLGKKYLWYDNEPLLNQEIFNLESAICEFMCTTVSFRCHETS